MGDGGIKTGYSLPIRLLKECLPSWAERYYNLYSKAFIVSGGDFIENYGYYDLNYYPRKFTYHLTQPKGFESSLIVYAKEIVLW